MTDQPPGARPPTPHNPGPDDPPRTQSAPSPSGVGGGQRFTDRVWSFEALVVVALVSLLLGGLAGAGLANVANSGEDRCGPGHRSFDSHPRVTPIPVPTPTR